MGKGEEGYYREIGSEGGHLLPPMKLMWVKFKLVLVFVVSCFQSSRELLQLFSRKYLAGEGDIVRHLSLIGYSATHTQVRHENTKHNNQLDFGYISPKCWYLLSAMLQIYFSMK